MEEDGEMEMEGLEENGEMEMEGLEENNEMEIAVEGWRRMVRWR